MQIFIIINIIQMKTNNFQKLKLNRQSSVKAQPQREVTSTQTLNSNNNDKLQELRAKIEQQRSIMRQSGKRFHKVNNNTPTYETQTSLQKIQKSEFVKKQKVSIEVPVGNKKIESSYLPVQPQPQNKMTLKQKVDLTSLIVEQQKPSLSSSRVFQQQHLQQKNRNKEVEEFLSKNGLGNFSEGLISLGYDEIEVLLQVTSEQLNFLMMRAPQQKVLAEAFKQYRKNNGLQQNSQDAINPSFTSTSTYFHSKAKNQFPKQQKNEAISYHNNGRLESKYTRQIQLMRPQSAMTIASTTPTNSSGVINISNPNPSFFIGIGGGEWSMESLVRRACGVCFKVMPGGQMIKEGDNYFCCLCKQKEDDPLCVILNNSMVRDYKL